MSSGLLDRARQTLAFKVALWYGVLFVAGSSALFALSYVLLRASLEQRDHDAIRSTLGGYVADYELGGPDAVRHTLASAEAMGTHSEVFLRVLGRNGAPVFASIPSRWAGFDLSLIQPPEPAGRRAWSRLPATEGGPVLDVVCVRLADDTVIQVGRSSALRDETLERFRLVLAAVFTVMLVMGLAGGALLTWAALRPVRELSEAARSIVATGQLEARVPTRGSGDALDALGVLFNSMLDRVQGLVRAMRQSLDNVAHDLRTPLMRVRSTFETTLQSESDVAAHREAIADGLEQLELVIAMLDSLTDISEAEAGTLRLHLESVGLGSLLQEAIELYSDLAEDRGVSLYAAPADSLVVSADRNRLLQVLLNLVDNSLKYTNRGGSVCLAAGQQDAEIVVSVADTGIGIAASDLPRIWERLYRGDKSRAERGLGLGLSLVKAIVEAHGGAVGVESVPGRGSRFSVRLPIADHSAPAATSSRLQLGS